MATQKVSAIEIEQAKKNLSKLPPKQHPSLPVGEALEELKPLIREAFDKNYSKEDVLEILGKCGINIKRYRLKELFGEKKLPSNSQNRSQQPAIE